MEWTISNGACPASSSVVTIYVGNAPLAQTIVGQTNVTAGETGVAYSVPTDSGSHYSWSLPAGAIITSSNIDSSQITINLGSEGGTVSVTETNLFGSTTSSLAVSINNVTGLITGNATDNYVISPNPFSNHTTIVVHNELTELIMLSIIDIQGKLCYSYSQYYTNEEFTLGSELASGIYFVQISYGNVSRVLKLVKVN